MVTDGFFTNYKHVAEKQVRTSSATLIKKYFRGRSLFEIHTWYCPVAHCGYSLFHHQAAT